MGWRTLIALLAATACSKGEPRRAPPPDAGSSAREPKGPEPPRAHDHDDGPRTPCPIADRLDVSGALDESARRYDAGDYPVALACADQAARISPESVEAHHNRAVALGALEKWEDAKQAFTLALAIDPDDPETLAGAAHFYVNRLPPSHELSAIGLEYARRGSGRAGRRRPDNELAARLALLEAQALDDLGRSDEALPRVEAALQLLPGYEDARFERAMILFHLCRLDRARAAFVDLISRDAADADAHHHLGLILEREGRDRDASIHFARAHAKDPERYPDPILLPADEFRAVVDRTVAALDPARKRLLQLPGGGVAIETVDLPALEDLLAVDPPFPPTILGLFRGAPHGEPQPGGVPRAIVLYRKNLARAVRSRAELEDQVRITLLHEIGHLEGDDEDDLRARGLE